MRWCLAKVDARLDAAARIIQGGWRAYRWQVLPALELLHQKRREKAAATKLQAVWKANRTKAKYSKQLMLLRLDRMLGQFPETHALIRNWYARQIQFAYRRYKKRRSGRFKCTQLHALIQFQRHIRDHLQEQKRRRLRALLLPNSLRRKLKFTRARKSQHQNVIAEPKRKPHMIAESTVSRIAKKKQEESSHARSRSSRTKNNLIRCFNFSKMIDNYVKQFDSGEYFIDFDVFLHRFFTATGCAGG